MAKRSAVFLSIAGLLALPVAARGEVLIFDGELFDHGIAVSGVFDFRFALYGGPEREPSDQLGDLVELESVEVQAGKFTVALDFGPELPATRPAWLAIDVAGADRWGGYSPLEPLQLVESGLPAAPDDNFPVGTVAFFDLAACPAGWSELVEARGRVLVGLQPGGTLRGTYGTALADLEARTHYHALSASPTTSQNGGHRHQWSSLANYGSGPEWRSYDVNGSPIVVFTWTNGIDDQGSGIYPLTASPSPGKSFFTATVTDHSHTVTLSSVPTFSAAGGLPYLQLRVCRKV